MVKYLEGAKDNRWGGFWNIVGVKKRDGSINYGLREIPPNEMKEVGTKVEAEGDAFERADVIITFHTPESVQAMIEALEAVKRRLEARR